MEIGRKRREAVGGVAQRGVHGEAAHPRPGIADGGEGVQKAVVGGAGPDGGFQSMLQPLGDAAHLPEGRLAPAGGPEKGQLAPPGGGEVGVLPGGVSLPVEGEDRLGHIGCDGLRSPLSPEAAEGAGTGEGAVGGVEGLAMVRALPGQGMGLHLRRKTEDGPAVLDGEVVVGLVEEGGHPSVGSKLSRCGLPRGGEALCPAGELGFEGGAVGVAVQKGGGFHQEGSVGGLGPENQPIAPGSGQ